MHIGILGTADNPYVIDLQRAARDHFSGLTTSVLRFGEMRVGIGDRAIEQAVPLAVNLTDAAPSAVSELAASGAGGEIDTLIVRSMPIGSLEQVIFRMDCLQTWLSRGVAIHNPPRSLEVAIDKWLCLQRLSEVGVPVPATICCQTRNAAMEAFELLGGDVLVKPIFGGEGRGILRANDKDLAWRIFGTLQQLGQVLYVQQFLEHYGYDIRVLFVGRESYAIRRVAEPGQWRTNISQGSRAEPHCLTGEQADIAERSRIAVGGTFLGVDLLPTRDGRVLVLEVNAVPGWRGLAKALNVDIACEFLKTVSRA
jgi:tetrahydromethanopterin:alpha-L-glutamate ligase